MSEPRIKVSPGNSKLGGIPNFSLMPIATCRSDVPCKAKCYACKLSKLRKNVAARWLENTQAVLNDMDQAFIDINDYLRRHEPRYFRIHVAGDFEVGTPTDMFDYYKGWCDTAKANPGTQFIAFTKSSSFTHEPLHHVKRPKNFKLIYSHWGKRHVFSTRGESYYDAFTYVDFKDGNKYWPDDSVRCPGKCEDCKLCFKKDGPKHIVFGIH